MKHPSISIIVVNWNSAEDLEEFILSLNKQTFTDFELIVVDNGSTDNSIDVVKKHFSKANIIQLPKNFGFAHPNNLGHEVAKGKYIATLNNDLVLPKDFLKNLFEFAESTKEDVFAIGCKMIFYHERDKINSVGIKPLINGNGINLGKNESSKLYTESMDIFGPCGGAALFKTSIINKIGLFDGKYFAYLEDLDLAHRAHEAGYKSIYCPTAICYHKRGATSARFPFFKLYLIERNRLINIVKHYPLYYLLFESFFTFFYILKNFLNKKNRSKISSDQKNVFKINNIPQVILIYIKARYYLTNYLLNKWKNS